MRFGSSKNRQRDILAITVGLALVNVFFACRSFAQTIPTPVPGRNAPAPGSPLPGVLPAVPPQVKPGLRPSSDTRVVPSNDAGAVFSVRSVTVEGASKLTAADVARLTAGLNGQTLSAGRIDESREKLVAFYRNQGYVYTSVTALLRGQDLVFQVVEGYIADVRLDGDAGPAGNQVLRFLNNLTDPRLRPLRAADLERWLLLAQDIPGLTVRSTLNPSEGEPGALTLIAQVSRQAVSGYFSADNRAFNLTGPEQALIAIAYNSASALGERTEFSLFRSFMGTNVFGQLSEEFYLGGSGLKLKIYGGAGNSRPGGQLAAIYYDSDTRVGGAQLIYPLVRSREQRLDLLGLFDVIESEIHNGNSGAGGYDNATRSSYDSLRVARLGFDYAMRDTLYGDVRDALLTRVLGSDTALAGGDFPGINIFNARYSQGLQILGSGHNGDLSTPPPRSGEKIDFTKFSGELSRTQTILHPTDNSSISLYGVLGWQYSGVLLPPAEKFYLGGPRFNRGYYYGQVSGDKGLTATGEIRYSLPLPSPSFVPAKLSAQFYLFHDWGRVWQNTALEPDVTLNSSGGGVRLYAGDFTEIDLEGVYRENRYPTGQGPGVSAARSAAFYWQVLFRY